MNESDDTTLGKNLVRTAAQAMYGAAYGPATTRKATRAVVAVLRTLREHDHPLNRVELRHLIEGIEKDA